MAIVLAVVVCAASAAWFASSWIDDPPDSTCGSLWRVDLWADGGDCAETMLVRAGLAGVLALLPAVGWLAVRHRRPAWVPAVMGCCVAAAVVTVLANELVRSGGAWSG